MHWVAPSEKGAATAPIEKGFGDAADSGLKSQEYSAPVLGLLPRPDNANLI